MDCRRSGRTDRSATRGASTLSLLLVLFVSAMLLSGCVLQPLEAQEPIDLAGETVLTLAIADLRTAGDDHFASGAGWEPSETVYVNLEATPDEEAIQATVAIATVDDDGRFNASFIYPLDPA